MRVCVYRNLNNGKWSVAAVSGNIGRGKVIGYVDEIALANVVFKTAPREAQKIAAGANKSVHAWFIGDVVAARPARGERLTYRPREGDTEFHTLDGRIVRSAPYALLAADKHVYL